MLPPICFEYEVADSYILHFALKPMTTSRSLLFIYFTPVSP